MKCARGFTLLEVIVCMGVVVLMFAIALPGLQDFKESSEQKKAARNVLAALRLARDSAITHNLEYQVAFDLDGCSYWLEKGNLPSDSTTWTRVREFDAFAPGLKMATKSACTWTTGDGDCSTADNEIQFNPNGTCGSRGLATSRYICIMDASGTLTYRSGVPSSTTGRAIIDSY